MVHLMPPGDRNSTTTVVFGRSYTCAPGSVLTNIPDADANILESNGWLVVAQGGSGSSSQRPVNSRLVKGIYYADSTLGIKIIYDGVTWRNPATGATV